MFPLCTCRLGQLGGGEACFHGTKSYQIRLYEVDTQKLREAKGSIRLVGINHQLRLAVTSHTKQLAGSQDGSIVINREKDEEKASRVAYQLCYSIEPCPRLLCAFLAFFFIVCVCVCVGDEEMAPLLLLFRIPFENKRFRASFSFLIAAKVSRAKKLKIEKPLRRSSPFFFFWVPRFLWLEKESPARRTHVRDLLPFGRARVWKRQQLGSVLSSSSFLAQLLPLLTRRDVRGEKRGHSGPASFP